MVSFDGRDEPIENLLLSALPVAEYRRLLPNLWPVTFSLGNVVYESGRHLDYVYFPTTSVVSLLYTTEDGSTAEMGLTGNDGAVGVAVFLGGDTTTNRAVVLITGGAFRMKAKLFQQEFARGAALNTPCCVTLRHSLHRSPRQPCATVSTQWRSAFADGCCYAMTESNLMSC